MSYQCDTHGTADCVCVRAATADHSTRVGETYRKHATRWRGLYKAERDKLAAAERELTRLRAIERAAREYLAATDAEDEADDSRPGALCAAWLVTNAAAAKLRALLTQADGSEGVERGR